MAYGKGLNKDFVSAKGQLCLTSDATKLLKHSTSVENHWPSQHLSNSKQRA